MNTYFAHRYFILIPIYISFRLNYKTNDLSSTPDLIYGTGDGTVNDRSLQGCTYWHGKQNQPIITKPIEKGEHFEILSNQQVVNYILDVLVHN